MCEYAQLSCRGKTHRIGKRTILRGLTFPTETNTFKERPALIISDLGQLPDGICAKFTAVPLKSNPFCHFDIPILTQFKYGDEKIGWIQADIERTFLFSSEIRYSVNNSIVCPDDVFDLVIKVKKLLLDAKRDSYAEAYELIKTYRIQFMNDYCIENIEYYCGDHVLYTLHANGKEVKTLTKEANIEQTNEEDATEVINYSESSHDESLLVPEVAQVKHKKHRAHIGNSKIMERKIRVSSLPDKDLKIFMRLISNGSRQEVADRMKVTPATITNRYYSVAEEMKKRNLDKFIVPYPYSR